MALAHPSDANPRGNDAASVGSAATDPVPIAAARGDSGALPTEFDRLKGLLLGEERARIADLQRRADDPETRARDLAEVLPRALRQRGESDPALMEALQQPFEHCMRRSVERDPRNLADALFPVMGPAIRRAITETLKGFVQSINQAVEHSLSVRGVRWRIEAMRSGTSFAEVVLKNTLLYRVDAAYLIDSRTGLLIDHAVAQTQTTLKDEDAVSAMLTAIQDFVQESFSQAGESLETVEIGNRVLWVLPHRNLSLACVISGIPPQTLRAQLDDVLHDLRKTAGPALREFNGDKSSLPGVHPLLEQCLALEYRDAVPESRAVVWWPWMLALPALAAGLGWLWWQDYRWDLRLEAARAALDAAPGTVLVAWEPGERIRARLLVDALAPDPAAAVTDPEVAARLDVHRDPYISAEPDFVLARAAQQLRPPETVALALEDGVLRIYGSAPRPWIGALRDATVLPAGVVALDLSALTPDDSDLLERAREALAPPEGVALGLDGNRLLIGGVAPWDWVRALPARAAAVAGLGGCDDRALLVTEFEDARALANEMADISVYFADGLNPAPEASAALDRAAAAARRLAQLDAHIGLGLRIVVTGQSDGIGAESRNIWLRQQRADAVAGRLSELGVPPELLSAGPAPGFEPSMVARPSHRRVDLRADLEVPARPLCAD